jgi:hypothetical protein
MFQPTPDVHRLLSVERAERLRADGANRPRRRGALRRTFASLDALRPHRHQTACEGTS